MTIALAQPQLDAIAAACRQHHVARLHAFGSVCGPITGLERPTSICWWSLKTFSPQTLLRLISASSNNSQRACSAVDLVMATAARNPIVRADIDGCKELVYAA